MDKNETKLWECRRGLLLSGIDPDAAARLGVFETLISSVLDGALSVDEFVSKMKLVAAAVPSIRKCEQPQPQADFIDFTEDDSTRFNVNA